MSIRVRVTLYRDDDPVKVVGYFSFAEDATSTYPGCDESLDIESATLNGAEVTLTEEEKDVAFACAWDQVLRSEEFASDSVLERHWRAGA